VWQFIILGGGDGGRKRKLRKKVEIIDVQHLGEVPNGVPLEMLDIFLTDERNEKDATV